MEVKLSLKYKDSYYTSKIFNSEEQENIKKIAKLITEGKVNQLDFEDKHGNEYFFPKKILKKSIISLIYV